MKLYYDEFLNPRKVCAVARHLGSPVEFVHVELAKGGSRTPQFLAINPNGKLPVLDTGERVIWESNAIMCQLAWMAGSDLWPRDERQVEIVRWLGWNAEHFSRYAARLYFEYVVKEKLDIGAPNAAAVEEANGYVRTYGAVLNDHLAGRRYLLDDMLTIADFAVAVTLPYAQKARLPLDGLPEVERWHARMNELPAWREPFPHLKAAA